MSGFVLSMCLLGCLAALAVAAVWSYSRGCERRRAVLLVSPAISVRTVEGAARGAMSSLLGEYVQVSVYCGMAEGERLEILRRLCAEYNVELSDRGAALRLWRGRRADFWRLCADGGVVKIR